MLSSLFLCVCVCVFTLHLVKIVFHCDAQFVVYTHTNSCVLFFLFSLSHLQNASCVDLCVHVCVCVCVYVCVSVCMYVHTYAHLLLLYAYTWPIVFGFVLKINYWWQFHVHTYCPLYTHLHACNL